ncbi:hypothetical protein [Curtobacterium oceanosedimentum]|uniref:hypothetical protein n=1 Tax=Curtobacterium oceanosedimentum TaxID=465820 RepID=UPI001CE180CB|nr:hypothetical protein [Curtobacterium oceanosedimentum]MCA5924769.1 hypothetical protein [Curtobacterium oceanosedimentum]
MSNMTDEEVRRSLRRSGRNTALFGLAFVLLSSLLFIAEWDQLGEPLGRKLFSLPRSVLFGLLLVCGLSLVGWGVRTVLSLRRR